MRRVQMVVEVVHYGVVSNHVRCTDQTLVAHHQSAIQQNRVFVRQLRRLLLDHIRFYPPTGDLHMRLVLLVRRKGGLADNTFVGTGGRTQN